jgi:hypothetical protein
MIIKLCIRNSKKHGDGSYSLYFSFADRGQTLFATTDVAISTAHNFKNGQIVKEQNANYNNAKLNQQLINYQRKYDKLQTWQKELPLPQIVELLRQNACGSDTPFIEFAQKIIADYKLRGQRSYLTKEYALQTPNRRLAHSWIICETPNSEILALRHKQSVSCEQRR